jgi:nucleoside 2-deoxyribosyltransferase
MRIFVAHASDFEFQEKLYGPIRESGLDEVHEFVLPEETGSTWDSRQVIESCDLLVAEVSVPSTGAGVEIGWADARGIPIIAIHEVGTVPSSMVQFLTDIVIEYESPEDLLLQLAEVLPNIG